MNGTTNPGTCDAFCEDISGFLDGELQFPESLATVDHLATCESCRSFYLASRRLAERVVAEPVSAAPDELWTRVAARAEKASERTTRKRTVPRRVWVLSLAAAAAIVLAVSVSDRRAAGPTVASAGSSVPSALREIVVEGARGRMTDERFFSILTEILSADQKYRRETERVLRFVDKRDNGESEAEAAPATSESETHEDAAGGESAGVPLES